MSSFQHYHLSRFLVGHYSDTQELSCPPAPVGVIDGSRNDVSFIVGMMLDKFA